jgi:hypothetical protein
MEQKSETTLDKYYLSQLGTLNLRNAKRKFEQFEKNGPKLSLSAHFQQKKTQKDLTQDILRIVAKKAIWLNLYQQETVADNVWLLYQEKAATREQALKLLAILLSIPYAEEMQDRTGTLNNFIYERILKFKNILRKQGLPSSYSPWQIPVTHLNTILERELQEKSEKEIAKLKEEKKRKLFQSLSRTTKAVEMVIKIIIINIGINKNPKRIFAQYNHQNQHCTEIAALQVFLNLLRTYAKFIINSIDDKKEFPSLENFMEEALTSSKNKAIEVERKNRFPIALGENDKEELLAKAKRCEYDQEKDISFLKKIISSWPECDVDGDIGKQVKEALDAANSFFKLELEYNKDNITEFLEIEKVLKQLGIINIECLPTHSTVSKKELETHLNKILQERSSIKKLMHQIEQELAPILKRRNIPQNSILNYFRRNLFQNPGNTHDYVHYAMQAYNSIMTST